MFTINGYKIKSLVDIPDNTEYLIVCHDEFTPI